MKNPFKPDTPAAFFWTHAGYSYNPQTQTRAQGRKECAQALADAETRGRAAGLSFDWSVDPDASSADFSDKKPAWALWQCLCVDRSGGVRSALGGIDFGRNGNPTSADYARVVEAELAAEATEG